jgi:hyperosmotically inducible periplasmic protein
MRSRLLLSTALLIGPLAFADPPRQVKSTVACPETSQVQADPQAAEQKASRTDVELIAKIRRSIIAEKSLSAEARNVKIIAQNGRVTLSGPVGSESEKRIVQQKASDVVGLRNLKSEIQVIPTAS